MIKAALFSVLLALPLTCVPEISVRGKPAPAPYIKSTQKVVSKFKVDPRLARKIVDAAYVSAHENKLAPQLVLGIIAKESSFRNMGNAWGTKMKRPPRTRNPMKAHGPMQVAGKWHKEKFPNGQVRWTSHSENIAIGTQIFKEYLVMERGDVKRALQRYNGNLADKSFRYAKGVLEHSRYFE